MSISFLDRYQAEPTWHGRAMIMEIYHLAMSHRNNQWTVAKTASHFNCSVGLVSENLKLAEAIHSNERLLNCESRQKALRRLNGYG